ncbi:protein phosphatase 2C 35-like [Phragmites australis]|uniref:protein phosphatase 2C 35-like n=1 Tax=Phragmites australis TaxID=29695 RepID=UPI002D76E818|nr:protein phosphatase 2C 35-like [Phragmites australis]
MGNSLACFCCAGSAAGRRRHVAPAALPSDPAYDEGLGHSFCYVRPDKVLVPFSADDLVADAKAAAAGATTFRAISGAALSANVSTPLSTSVLLLLPDESAASSAAAASSGFESSESFAAVPLQPVPRFPSGPICAPAGGGFLSGPIERGFLSGPLDAAPMSGPLTGAATSGRTGGSVPALRRSLSHGGRRLRNFTRALLARADKFQNSMDLGSTAAAVAACGADSGGLQWAQGKAGEDRVHIVVSEERGWVFVGIYDGFNGPDATDFLVSNLYAAVHRELRGLLWDQRDQEEQQDQRPDQPTSTTASDHQDRSARRRRAHRSRPPRGADDKQRLWKCEWERDCSSLKPPTQPPPRSDSENDHIAVLKALARALHKTEEAYLDVADKMVGEFPELALMGSCVLAMLMKGEDMYLMNVGDSRAVLGTMDSADLEQISVSSFDGLVGDCSPCLSAVQLTREHSTSVQEEVCRIRNEHPDDPSATSKDRVKGSLKVTRAFGAGFLKQPKWNDALLEVFRIDYVGSSPYITCNPSLFHHRLSTRDRFLILSSDGLYQYFTNEEAVAHVEMFIATTPEGDPAQHLVEEVLFRAANKAGMDFHELIEIPHGDRRRYHDDVSVIVISLEGRIWRSCV